MPGTRNYVFKGVAALAQTQPLIVTGDTWDQQTILVDAARRNGGVIINVFNIDKINKDGGRVRHFNEYVGSSYFEFLSRLDDFVLVMDEAHRDRAEATLEAVTDSKPVLGLELTATSKSVGARPVDFRNVVYRFGLGEAMAHRIVSLRASTSDILTEQTLGRGLRLPDGERTGVEAIDRLTIIAHDRFDEIIAKAREPGSVIAMKAVVIGGGGDIPDQTSTLIEVPSWFEAA